MVASSSGGRKPTKVNLKWNAEILKAKAGISSKMAVPKRIASKTRNQLKKKAGARPAVDEALQARLNALGAERLQRQRHHLAKQLVQAAKKARTFLVRRVLRKASAEGGTADAGRLAALRAVSPAAVARHALQPLGLADVVVAERGDDESGEAEAAPSAMRDEWVKRLVGTPAVQQQLDKVRAHVDAHPLDGAVAAVPAKPKRKRDEPASALEDAGDGAAAATGTRKRPSQGGEAGKSGAGGAKAKGSARAAAAPKSAAEPASRFMTSLAAGDSEDDDLYGDGAATEARAEARAEAGEARRSKKAAKNAVVKAADVSDEDDEEGGGLVLGSARDGGRDGGSRSAKGKKALVISRSGNRMGQRQRQRLIEQQQAKESGGGEGGGKGGGGKGGGAKGGGKGGKGKGGGKGSPGGRGIGKGGRGKGY